MAIQAHMHLMLIDLLRNHHYRNSSAYQNAVFDILSVYDYIEQHLCENLTLGELAQVAGVSPNHFSYVCFKTASFKRPLAHYARDCAGMRFQ